VDGAICAITFVQPPMCRCDNGISVLVSDIAGHKTKHCLSNFSLHGKSTLGRNDGN
jgi:hypothetical protein